MAEGIWLIDETRPLNARTRRLLERELPHTFQAFERASSKVPNIAIRLRDIIIHDNKKWFGEADIRLDGLVIHGRVNKDEPNSYYMPQTFRFPRVADGDMLPIGDEGLLIYYGKPLYFLDIFITVSRDRKDSDDLSKLLTDGLKSKEIQGAVSTVLVLAMAVPQVAAVTSALGAAAAIGGFAYQILCKLTGSTVGLYRNSFLQHQDNFGIGDHPENGVFRKKDLSFRYEIIVDE